MAPDRLFTRDEALGGLPARRAAATLFLIESRAAYLADQSRRAGDFLVSEDAVRRRDLVFLEAFNGGREPPVKPTIEHLERFAPHCAALVPATPSLRAAIAHMLGRKYAFTRAAVPRLRQALGLDDEAVGQAYRRQYREELATIYVPQLGVIARLRLAWGALSARIESLSPFWLTFWLTIAFSFSQAFLALPTGVAGVGALPGLGLVIAIGMVNVLTMACMAEACARSGDFRYGRAFVGRLVAGYLGAEASAIFSVITALRTFLVTLAGSIGIGLTLAASTGIRPEIWLAILTAVELYYLSRRSLNLTITTMLALVGVNVGLSLLIALIALPWVEPANLLRMHALSAAGSFDPSVLKLVLGVTGMLYIGHVYVIQCSRIVLPRDPSARSLIRGIVAGTAALAGVFALWIVAVNGVVRAERLIGEAGTALPSLAERIGPVIHVMGSLLVVLLLGMSCLRTSTVLFNLVQERLPTRLQALLTVHRRRGELLFQPRRGQGTPRVGIRYLGLSGSRARLGIAVQTAGDVHRTEAVVADRWDGAELLSRLPGMEVRAETLVVDILDARPAAVTVRVTTTMSLAAGGDWSRPGRHITDVALLEEPLRELVTWLTRRGEATLAEVVRDRGGEPEAVRATLDTLIDEEFVEAVGDGADARYRVHLAARPRRQIAEEVWTALEPPGAPSAAPTGGTHHPAGMRFRAWSLISSESGRFVISTSPILLVFLLGEALLLARTASFAGVLGFGGVIANSVTAGIFPVLLLAASRRKSDYVPAVVYRLLGHPAFTIGVYALSLVNLLLHGLVIYQDPWMRACALLLALVVVGTTARIIRGGAFTLRATMELREDLRASGMRVLTIMSGGRPLSADVTVELTDGGTATTRTDTIAIPELSTVQTLTVRLPPGRARELKVWAHRVTADGFSGGLPAQVEVHSGTGIHRFDVSLSGGQAITPVRGESCRVRITLPSAGGP